jgi:hypothetical protein
MCCRRTDKSIINDPSKKQITDIYQIVSDASVIAEAASCIWVSDSSVEGSSPFAPVFLIPDAAEVYRDLYEWSDNRPDKWFTLDWAVTDDRYSIVLMPNLSESVKRFKLRNLIEREDLSSGDKVILFQPLRFGSRPMLQSRSPNGLIDMSEFDNLSAEEQKIAASFCHDNMITALSIRLPSGSKGRIGLLDPRDIVMDKLSVSREPMWIGPLDIVACSDNAIRNMEDQKRSHDKDEQ